jgi:plasmid stabilization system protein ParE
VAQVVYSAEAFADLERIVEHLLDTAPEVAAAALARVRSAVDVLATHPQIGRRVDGALRQLVISHGGSGYLALYRFDAGLDVARVLRIRHQREAGYTD